MSDENKRIEIDGLPRVAEDLTAEEAQGVTGRKRYKRPDRNSSIHCGWDTQRN